MGGAGFGKQKRKSALPLTKHSFLNLQRVPLKTRKPLEADSTAAMPLWRNDPPSASHSHVNQQPQNMANVHYMANW